MKLPTLICSCLVGMLVVSPCLNAAYVVRMDTVLGDVDIWLRDDITPGTVDNFLRYIQNDRYRNTFIHRSEPEITSFVPAIIQGGGYYWDDALSGVGSIEEFPAITNEYNLPNTRGTIAMAKLGGNPNSATSEWFINLDNNATSLAPPNNGGFTVFGQVIGDGMDVIDEIAALPIYTFGGAFNRMPLIDFVLNSVVQKQNLVLINNISIVTAVPGPGIPIKSQSGQYTVAIFDPSDTVSYLRMADEPAGAPDNIDFPEGFFDFELSLAPGNTDGTTIVAFALPEGNTYNTYYKYGPTPDNATPHWYEFTWNGRTGARIYNDQNLIVLTFRDGELGDDDLAVNGTIVDIGGPGVAPRSGGGGGSIGYILFALLGFASRYRRAQ